MSEWWYISNLGKNNEQKRDDNRSAEHDLVFSDDDGFTILDVVPTVNVCELEEDDDDENDVGVQPGH